MKISFDFPPEKHYNDVMILRNLSHSINDMFLFILPLILPVILGRYQLSFTGAGSILTVFMLVLAIGSFLLGKLSDFISREKIVGWGFLVASAGFIAAAIAPSYPLFLAAIIIGALGTSTFHPIVYALLDEQNLPNRSRVLAVYEAYGTSAILVMFMINGFLLTRLGANTVLAITAVPGFFAGALFLRLKTPSGGSRGTETIRRDKHSSASGLDAAAGRNRQPSAMIVFLLFVLSALARMVTFSGIMNFLPLMFVELLDTSPDIAAYATACFFAGGIPGTLITGRLAGKFDPLRIHIVLTTLMIFPLLLLGIASSGLLYIIAAVLIGMIGSSCFITQVLLLKRYGSHLGKGELYGIVTGSLTVTSSVSPIFFGMGFDAIGISSSILFSIVPVALSVLILLYLGRSTAFR